MKRSDYDYDYDYRPGAGWPSLPPAAAKDALARSAGRPRTAVCKSRARRSCLDRQLVGLALAPHRCRRDLRGTAGYPGGFWIRGAFIMQEPPFETIT